MDDQDGSALGEKIYQVALAVAKQINNNHAKDALGFVSPLAGFYIIQCVSDHVALMMVFDGLNPTTDTPPGAVELIVKAIQDGGILIREVGGSS